MNIRKVLESGSVVRYHSTLIEKKQNNDSHQWEVAVVLEHIYPECSKRLLFHALTHDAAEIATGDVPAPVKQDHPELKEAFDMLEFEYFKDVLEIFPVRFSEEEKLAIKYADIISGLYFTTRRINAGDREAIVIRDKWVQYVANLPYLNEVAARTIEELKQ